MGAADNRRTMRFRLEVPAWFKNTRYQQELSLATTLNVSATGLCILTREPVEVGQFVLMQVKLPPEDRLIINTRVVWVREILGSFVREYQVGLKLVEPMQFEESRFVRFCAQKMVEFYREHNHPLADNPDQER